MSITKDGIIEGLKVSQLDLRAEKADLERQLAEAQTRLSIYDARVIELRIQRGEAQGKLKAIELEAHDWNNSERAWYCRRKINAILGDDD